MEQHNFPLNFLFLCVWFFCYTKSFVHSHFSMSCFCSGFFFFFWENLAFYPKVKLEVISRIVFQQMVFHQSEQCSLDFWFFWMFSSAVKLHFLQYVSRFCYEHSTENREDLFFFAVSVFISSYLMELRLICIWKTV